MLKNNCQVYFFILIVHKINEKKNNHQAYEQVTTKWTPAKFGKISKEINFKKIKLRWSDKGISWFHPEIFMINESWNPIRPEANLATPNQEGQTYILSSIDDYLLAEIQGHRLGVSCDTADQRVLHFDWTRDTTGHTQPKVVVSGTTFIDN